MEQSGVELYKDMKTNIESRRHFTDMMLQGRQAGKNIGISFVIN